MASMPPPRDFGKKSRDALVHVTIIAKSYDFEGSDLVLFDEHEREVVRIPGAVVNGIRVTDASEAP